MANLATFKQLRDALKRQHDWHLAQTEPVDMGGVPIIPAEAYAEGSMCEETEAALDILNREVAKFERIRDNAKSAVEG